MTRQNCFVGRRLGLESLEGRLLMAANPFGNVQVTVAGGDLILTGDNLQHDVQIVQTMVQGTPVPGSYFVAPRNGTTINGSTTGQYFIKVTHDIRATLGTNNDRLLLGNGSSNDNFIVPNDLFIDTKGGDIVRHRREPEGGSEAK